MLRMTSRRCARWRAAIDLRCVLACACTMVTLLCVGCRVFGRRRRPTSVWIVAAPCDWNPLAFRVWLTQRASLVCVLFVRSPRAHNVSLFFKVLLRFLQRRACGPARSLPLRQVCAVSPFFMLVSFFLSFVFFFDWRSLSFFGFFFVTPCSPLSLHFSSSSQRRQLVLLPGVGLHKPACCHWDYSLGDLPQ